MDLNIQSTADQNFNKLNVMIYGLPGAGKTRFMGSAARGFKTIIASAESGLLSLRGMKDENGRPVKADFVEIKKWEDLEQLNRYLMAGTHDYECFGIDSGTEIQQVCMDHILAQEGRDKPQLQDWGTLNNKMVRMIRYFRDNSKMNMIMTALAENLTEPDGSTKYHPMFQGRLQKAIAGYFDEVVYAYVHKLNPGTPEEENKHVIVCQSSDKLVTKDRSGLLPKVLPNDFCEIYSRIYHQKEQK